MENMGQFNNITNGSLPLDYRIALATMYSIVLVGGTLSTALMINILKSNVRSVTTMAVLNLVVVHILFLLTVPFRIYFYASGWWDLGPDFCKVVSSMIHVHMYVALTFYVIILVIRHLAYARGRDQVEFHRRLHAALVSAGVWAGVLVCVLPAVATKYGTSVDNRRTCFNFGDELDKATVAGLNYALIAVVLLAALAVAGSQAWILGRVVRAYGRTCPQRQEFWAQIKSLSFVLVVLVCFVPYHLFRLYYVGHHESLQKQNEVFLAVTAFSCFDMLIFLPRDMWTCGVSCCVNAM
ncbi:probable G-protein coupled receptor 141 [Megalops cyprinoides]|uniref:probable G-protein coupled receptor 141 n=1 Tax=Megalops cyprinoides TaxID=118141 RepID=UPI001864ECAD|nr:probable G-protein coupled receptor 141 [Megalops cyprinoides]